METQEQALRGLMPLRHALAGVLGDTARDTWLVGGVVRDALLGRELPDLDLVTAGSAEAAAQALRRALGGAAFPLGDRHGCWRVVVAAGGGGSRSAGPLATVRQVDVCSMRGDTLADDLAMRDFAANALAVPVLDPVRIIDHHGGVSDVEQGRLRMVAAQCLDDDPLRMLRAARLSHVLDWDIDAATAAAIRERAAAAVKPAGERTFAELRSLLLHPEARRGWRILEHLGLDAVLLPELEACRGMAQSRFHHLDVHDHTLAVLDNCEDVLAAHHFWLPLPDEPGLAAGPWSDDQRLVVLLAALCHDLGKPATRQEHPHGRVSFAGHDEAGIAIVDAIGDRLRWSNAVRDSVRRLVATHLALGYLLHSDRSERQLWRWRRQVEPVVAEAVVLSVGDRLATAGPDDRRRWVRAHLELAREAWASHWREVRDGVPVPLLDGRAIAEAARVEPGPQLGRLVQVLAEEQAVGAVQSREQAEQLVRERVLSEPTAPTPSRGT